MKAKLNISPDNQSLLMRRRNELLGRPTEAEKHVQSLLETMGENFIPQKGFFTTYRFFFVDFYLPKRRKLCLEIDGAYHKRQPAYDKARDRFLKERRGFRFVRIANDTAMRLTPATLLALIGGANNGSAT